MDPRTFSSPAAHPKSAVVERTKRRTTRGRMKPSPQLREKRLAPDSVRSAVRTPASFSVEDMGKWVDSDCHAMRADLRDFLKDDLFVGRYHDSLEQMRALATRRLRKLAETPGRFFSIRDFETDPRRIFAAHEITCMVDGSFATKLTVQANLSGGTILKLGTERHHAVLAKFDKAEEVGCFGLTELGYGNNAIKLETTAHYDAQTHEFVVNTPTPLAQKYWITNGAIDAHWCVVFAQTFVNGKHEGVQALLVRIRDKDLRPLPGVTIEDMGQKMGQNGVDNARIGFRNVRVPREMFLNRYADVDASGKFVSSITNPRARFIAALNQLLSGRLCLSSKGVGRCKQALTIAVRYSLSRLCVGESGESDTPIMDNGLQQRAFLPLIARTYAVSVVGMTYVKDRFVAETTANNSKGLGAVSPELEVLCSGIKALNTWHTERVASITRERCGGQGYLAANKFAEILGDAHAICTAEGDNSVLMIKVAKERLAWAKKDGGKWVASALAPFVGFEDVRNPDYLLALFKRREATQIAQLQGVMDHDMRHGSTLFEVWSVRQSDAVQALARSYIERVCLEQFLARIASAPKSIKLMLEQLAVLFALDVVEKDAAWFLTSRVLTVDQGAHAVQTCRDMCLQLAPQAIHLVDAFSVPEHLLPPAARDWVKYNTVHGAQGELLGVAY